MAKWRSFFVLGVFALVTVTCSIRAYGQAGTATVSGRVADSSGLAVPQAQVQAVNINTNVTYSAQTGNDGLYSLPNLPPGRYRIVVQKQGFEEIVNSGLDLHVADSISLNFTLKVGSISQSVTVEAAAPLVNTTNGTLGGLVSDQKVADLPLNGRNYIDLTLLQPGITQHRNVGANPSNAGLWYSSNGAPVHSNNYLLDGARMNNLQGVNGASAAGYTLGVDGIREYRIITNNFSAEYGMSMGSQVVAVSKGGTNDWHGDAFDYLRNSVLDARNFFDAPPSVIGRRLPQFQRNDFGGSFGGPIKKDNTFFYAVYEGVRQRQGLTNVIIVPGAGCHGPAGAVLWNGVGSAPEEYDSICPQLGGATSSTATIASDIAPILNNVYPIPNLPGNEFTYPFTAPTRDDYGQIRMDHNFSTNDNLFVRYTIDDAEQFSAVIPAGPIGPYPGFTMNLRSRNQFVTVSENHIFSPALVNTASMSFSRTAPWLDSTNPFTGPQYAFMPGNSFFNNNMLGDIDMGGLSNMGVFITAPTFLPQNIYTWSDDLFYTRGKHSLKFGTLINRLQQMDYTARLNMGLAVFPNLASFLTSGFTIVQTALLPGSVTNRDYRSTTLGFYAQDDYRVTPRLTLNLGLRYEFMTQLHERYGFQAALVDPQFDAATTVGIPFKNPTLHNYSPRVGFAWDVMGDGKTSVRGGFAMLYDLTPFGTAFDVMQTDAPPFASSPAFLGQDFSVPFSMNAFSISSPPPGPRDAALFDYNMKSQHILDYNLAVERQLPFAMSLSVAYAGSKGLNLMSRRDVNPAIPQGVPDASGNCVARPAGQAIDLTSMVSGIATACWLGGDPRINPNWTSIMLQTNGAFSVYNALEILVTKRLSKGFQFQSAYTWSKLMDNGQAEAPAEVDNGPVYPVDAFHPKLDYSLSLYDSTHNWRFNALYQFPQLSGKSGVVAKLVNGWQVAGIVSLQSGYPFDVTLLNNRSRSGVFDSQTNLDRPNLAPGRDAYNITHGVSTSNGVNPCPTAGKPLGTPNLWFDPCAFLVPQPGFLGNAPKNFLRGPGLSNVDFSLIKDTAIPQLGESGTLEFRAEMFNLFNRTNFAMPSQLSAYPGFAPSALDSPFPNAGLILSTFPATSRQIQFALKLLF
jgi:hypothetical protein